MYKPMSHHDVISWVGATADLIEVYLNYYGIPYKRTTTGISVFYDQKMRRPEDSFNDNTQNQQFTFDWCEGDVVIGCMHCTDGYVQLGTVDILKHPYPSIETYHFPWDKEDITVFDSPELFVYLLANYYENNVKKNEEVTKNE